MKDITKNFEDLFESLTGAIFLDFSEIKITTKPSLGTFGIIIQLKNLY